MLKVAHLTTVDLSLRYLVFPQLTSIVERGGKAIGISSPGPDVEALERAGITHIALRSSTRGMNLIADLRAAAELYRILKREAVDVLHTHNPKPGIYGRIVGRLAGVPIVVNTIHGLYATEDDPLAKRGLVYILEALASRFSDAELAQNPEDLELMLRLRLVPRSKISYLGNGVDLARFDPNRAKVDRDEVRGEWGAGPDQVVIGIVGRLVAEKGYPELFEAFARLDRDRYQLVVVGPDDPSKPDALDRTVVAAARAAGVRFLGMRTDVDRLYSGFDLFVLPSHREGFPRAAMEAAASGLPIIATDIRGCRQVVDDGKTGLLVPVRDSMALAGAIERLGSDPRLRSEMAAAGASKARAEFDEKRVVDTVLATYRRASVNKGLEWLFSPPEELAIRPAVRSDALALSQLHRRGITSGFLSSLGPRFLRLLYERLIEDPDSTVIVADGSAGVVGFVACTADTARFYRSFAKRRGLRAAAVVAPRLLRWETARRVYETARYGSDEAGTIPAEFLSMAMAPAVRAQGVGSALVEEMFQWARSRGLREMKVVVGAGNERALRTFQRLGFSSPRHIEVHRGEPSVEMVWRP
jgi:glycosyltransferase involved in cell wall biosynthesis/GNAT superfamily N-acetyltransferase